MRRRAPKAILIMVLTPALLALGAVASVLFLRQGGMAPFQLPGARSLPVVTPQLAERGRYLARLGNCVGCHTTNGGPRLAGGRAFHTEYGTVYSTNLTPDRQHGIGDWSREEFRHAMRHGVSRHGVSSPVFPYSSFRHLSDEDLDALRAFLSTVPPSARPRTPNALEFPANLPGAMMMWRLLFLRPPAPPVSSDATAARGEYLVRGIGHCATCHASRGAFASFELDRALWGARVAGWHAPALHGLGLKRFAEGELARYLQGGAPRAVGAYGLMADVVSRNLQYLSDEDALAIEVYLRTLQPPPPEDAPQLRLRAGEQSLRVGRTVYEEHCAACHGDEGQGEPDKYPSLRDSPAIVGKDPVNLIKLVLFGAVAPSTSINPLPYTMPPSSHVLTADEVAGVVNYLRVQADTDAMPVSPDNVRALGGIH